MGLNQSKRKDSSTAHSEPTPDVPTLSDIIEEPSSPIDNHALNHLNQDIKMHAELILQEVLDDFVPHIEAELRKRLSRNVDTFLMQLAEKKKRR